MPRQIDPELKRFLGRQVSAKLNGNRKVTGVLQGFDSFMNLVLAHAQEVVSANETFDIGTIVRGVIAWNVTSS